MKSFCSGRVRVAVGLLALLLTFTFTVAGAEAPGKLVYSKSPAWPAEISISAPLDADLVFDLTGCIVLGPSPCKGIRIKKGGALTLDSAFIAAYFAGSDIGVIDAPSGAWTASTFLPFNDGVTQTAFTAGVLRNVLVSPLDDFRAATAARTPAVRDDDGTVIRVERSTCTTLFNDGDHATAVQIASYGEDGERARSSDGHVASVDVHFIDGKSVAQACLGDVLNDDGTVRVAGPVFTAGSVRVSFGCGGVGPCPGPAPVWLLVTKGPVTGATVETLQVDNVGGGAASAGVSAAAVASSPRDFSGVYIRALGSVPAAARAAIDAHNAEVLRKRRSS